MHTQMHVGGTDVCITFFKCYISICAVFSTQTIAKAEYMKRQRTSHRPWEENKPIRKELVHVRPHVSVKTDN